MPEEEKIDTEQDVGEKLPPPISIAGKHILCSEVSSLDNRLYSGSSVPRGEILIWDILKPRRILHRLPPVGWSPPESYDEKSFEPYTEQERFHTMPVMGIKLIGQILVSVSLDGTIILWDNLRSLSEDSPPKAIHVIFNENTPSEENNKISLFKADKEGSYNKKCLDIESKAFLYALVVGYVAAIIVALASWFGGQRSELASVLSGVAAGIFFGALTGIIKYILSLRTAHDSGSDGKTVDYKNVEMAEQGKQGTPNVFESAEDGLVSPENVLGEADQHDENAALPSVVSGSLNGSELDRVVDKGSAKGKRSPSHKDSELGNEDQNSGAEKGDAEVDEETDGKALSRVLSGASVVSKGASAVTAPVLKKAPSVATPDAIAGNLLLAASGNFQHEVELESTLYLPRPGSTLGRLLNVENPSAKLTKSVANEGGDDDEDQPVDEDGEVGSVGFTCLDVLALEDPPADLIQSARIELVKTLKRAVGKAATAAEGYLVFAGDERGVVTIWMVLPHYFSAIPTGKGPPLTPKPLKVCSLRIGQTQMVTAVFVDGQRLYAGGQFGSVVSWDLPTVLAGNYDDGVCLSSDRCRTRVTSLAVEGNRLFVGALGNFNFTPGYRVEYLGFDVRWTPAVVINVKPDPEDITLTKYDIIAHPDYDASENPNGWADWLVLDVDASRLRNFKNEDSLAHLKKSVSLFASTLMGAVDGLTTVGSLNLAKFVNLQTSPEFDLFKANVEAFIDATGAKVDFGTNQRWVYGTAASAASLTMNTLAAPLSLQAPPSELRIADNEMKPPATIFVWDVSEWDDPPVEPTWELAQHLAGVSSLLVEGTRLYSGSYDQSVCVWDITPAQTTAEWEMDSNLPPPVSWKQPTKLVRISGFSGAIHCISSLDGDIIAGTSDYSIEGTSMDPLVDKCGPGPAPGPNPFQFELQELDGFAVNAFPDPYGIWIPTKRNAPKPWINALSDFVSSSISLFLFSLWPGRFFGVQEEAVAANEEEEIVEGESGVGENEQPSSALSAQDYSLLQLPLNYFWSGEKGAAEGSDKRDEEAVDVVDVDPEQGIVGETRRAKTASERPQQADGVWLQSSLQLALDFLSLSKQNEDDSSLYAAPGYGSSGRMVGGASDSVVSQKETKELLDRAQQLLERANSGRPDADAGKEED